ncbi:MAG: FIST C-terminal domain-containing protein [Lachnospiraceae bacterium]|nr:FIST C-terminal domain-containing protein [Lachnospiraceae bacterium]
MDSITAYTEEIDDLEEATEELFSQIEGFKFLKNSIAILFTEEETDYPELYRILSDKWDFPIIGCTAMGMFLGKEGYCNMGISVMILTADDCEFASGMTGELNTDNYKAEIKGTYDGLRKTLKSEPKIIISFGGMVTDESHAAGDDLVAALTEAGGGIPVYGAAASDAMSFDNFRIFSNGEITRNGQVMVLISGNIDPKFVCVNSVENKASFSYEITESKGNLVYRLGNGSFLDALKKADMATDKTDVLGDYLLSPFLITMNKGENDMVEVARNLSVLNQENGMGSFLGVMPEGSIISIGILNRSDVQKSVDSAFDRILKDISDSGDKYHTLLCSSCIARFLALAGNTSAEAETYNGRLPEGVSLMGIYGYGEYCPVKGNKTGKEYNMFHNFTFTILAI